MKIKHGGANLLFTTYREAYNAFMLDNDPYYRCLHIQHTTWGAWRHEGPIQAYEVYRIARNNGLDYPKMPAYEPRDEDI